MKRDMDLIRALMLEIEERDTGDIQLLEIEIEGHSQLEVFSHLRLLIEAGLIAGLDLSSHSGINVQATRLTWTGHDFLDSIRDDEIWQQTKDGAAAAGGFTLELLSDLAKGLIKTKIAKHTGVEI